MRTRVTRLLGPGLRLTAIVAALVGAAGCSDSGPQAPILFVSSGPSSGAGTVTSTPAGINCSIENNRIGGVCSANFEGGTVVSLTASNAAGSSFLGWGAGCTGTLPTCSVSVDADLDVTADFQAVGGRTLTITGAGNATGEVTSNPAGINCVLNAGATSGTCSAGFGDGVVVTLTAVATGASAFSTWTGDCLASGTTPNCVLAMTANRGAGAGFTASTTFSGFLAQTNSSNTAVFVVSIPTGAPFVAGAAASRAAALAQIVLPAAGTITVPGSTPIVIAGTFDTDLDALSVTGGGWTLNGSLSGQEMNGGFSDPDGNSGVLTALVTGSGEAPTIYCGDFTGEFTGTLQLSITPDTLRGVVNSSQISNPLNVAGSVQGREVGFSDENPDGPPFFPATGTISPDDVTIAGTWRSTSGNTWTVQTPCQ